MSEYVDDHIVILLQIFAINLNSTIIVYDFMS